MKMLIGKALRLDFSFDKTKIKVSIALHDNLLPYVDELARAIPDIYDRGYNSMFNLDVSIVDNRVIMRLGGYPIDYMFEKFVYHYLQRIIGFAISKGDISRKLVGAELFLDYFVIINNREDAYVFVLLEEGDPIDVIKCYLGDFFSDTHAKIPLTVFNRILSKNRNIFLFVTPRDEHGGFEFYEPILGEWIKITHADNILSFEDKIVIVDPFHEVIEHIHVETIRKYIREIIGAVKRTLKKKDIRVEDELLKDACREELQRIIDKVENILNKYCLAESYMGIYLLLRDLEDCLKECNIDLPARKKYLLKRLFEILRKIQTYSLNWTMTKFIAIASIITKLYYDSTKEYQLGI